MYVDLPLTLTWQESFELGIPVFLPILVTSNYKELNPASVSHLYVRMAETGFHIGLRVYSVCILLVIVFENVFD